MSVTSHDRSGSGVVLLLSGALLFTGLAAAQESPYAGQEQREIKALSAEHGYPGPKHVLELRQELGLSLDQLQEIQRAFEAMRGEAMRLGGEIVERERQLDAAFASEAIDAASLTRMTEEIGRLNGQLRSVHLRAHLDTARILSPHQRMLYVQLRGYVPDGGHGRHH